MSADTNGRTGLVRWKFAVLVLAVGIPAIALLIVIREARNDAYAAICVSNLAKISHALRVYHDVHGRFPPAYVADTHGRPMHSWRTLILPYLDSLDIDAERIHRQYNFSEPWDSPKNRRLATPVERSRFACPLGDEDGTTRTSYVAIVDDATLWPGADTTTLTGPIESWPDTILVVEVQGLGIEWMEPRDITLEELIDRLNRKTLPNAECGAGVVRFVTACRSIRSFEHTMDIGKLRQLCERNRARRNASLRKRNTGGRAASGTQSGPQHSE